MQKVLTPDDVKIYVPWDEMQRGDSVFFPCWDTRALARQLVHAAPFKVRTQIRVESGYRGVRIWRV